MRARIICALVLFAGVAAYGPSALAAMPTPTLSTPPGVTFGDVYSVDGRFLWRYVATDLGKPLYTFDADGNAGRPTCSGECAQQFTPYLAPDDAKVSSEWSLIARDGKQRQWAYRGRPLYAFSGKDPVPYNQFELDSFVNDKAAVFDPRYLDPSSDFFSPQRGWRRAAFRPEESTPLPSGILLKSLSVANGYGFVDASTNMPLYIMSTSPKDPRAWNPIYAPDLAGDVGDFSVFARADGRKQWAYKGHPLYSYKGDYVADDLNGPQEQKDAQPALAYHFFIPRAARIENMAFRGPLMVAANGMSLYTEVRSRAGSGGRQVQMRACIDECLKSWIPLAASSQDRPSGFWQIYKRPDGSRQWAYNGAALYTYVDDKKPGDVEGNNKRIVIYGDRYGKNMDEVELAGGLLGPNVRIYAGAGFIWRVVGLANRSY